MSPKQEGLWRTLKTKIDKVVIAVFGILLLVMALLYFNYETTVVSPELPVPKEHDLKDRTAESQDYQLLMRRTNPEFEFEESDYYVLGTFNMFDYQTVRDKETIDREADAKFGVAKTLRDEGDMQGALKRCNEVLLIRPSHIPAREMKAEIEKRLKEEKKEGGRAKAS